MAADRLLIGVVVGEESGDLLAADLVAALSEATGRPVDLVGVGGERLQARGLQTLFDPGEIALMGFTAVIARLPALIARIRQTATALAEANPDCVIVVDSPDFTHRVARRLRAAAPHIPIVDYVCPSVWAWRPARARAMRAFIDHVLCLLPFEAEALDRLGGPQATYVGHRLTRDAGLLAARAAQQARERNADQRTLLLLPGSRIGEVKALLPYFGETVAFLDGAGPPPRLILPTVPHVEGLVRAITAQWPRRPEIIVGETEKYTAFGEADAAMAASGTVTLELALAGVPTISNYRTDVLARLLRSMITAWSACLPNLIADRPIVLELYDFMLRPGYAGRHLLALMEDGPARMAQLAGFETVRAHMATERPAGEIAAEAVVKLIEAR